MSVPQVLLFAERGSRFQEDVYDAAVGAMQTAIAASFSKKAADALSVARRKKKADRSRRSEDEAAGAERRSETDEPDVNELWPESEG